MSALPGLVGGSQPVLAAFVLVLARVAGMVMIAPLFGSRTVPLRIRAAVALFVAVAVAPMVGASPGSTAPTLAPLALIVAIAVETLIGSAIGLVGQLVFAGVLLAGELAGIEMGLGLAGLIDPQHQTRSTAIAEWQHLIAILVFLSLDGHHVLLQAVAESFVRVPIGALGIAPAGLAAVLALAGEIFVIGLKIAAPVLLLVLLVNVAMGALARLLPQLNVMAVGFPVNVAAGFLALAISQPTVIRYLGGAFAAWNGELAALLDALG